MSTLRRFIRFVVPAVLATTAVVLAVAIGPVPHALGHQLHTAAIGPGPRVPSLHLRQGHPVAAAPAGINQDGQASLLLPWLGRTAGRGEVRFVGRLGGPTTAVAANGDVVYAAIGGQLATLDAAHPATIRLIGYAAAAPGTVSQLLVVSDTLYAISDGSKILAYDVSVPAEPHLRSQASVPTGVVTALRARDGGLVASVGGNTAVCLALVSDDGSELTIEGVMNDPGGSCSSVETDGTLAYVVRSKGRVVVVDISDPSAPEVVTQLATGARMTRASVLYEDHLYIAHAYGLQVIDVGDPVNPSDVASLPLRASIDEVVAGGDRLYLADATFGLRTVDVSEPAEAHVTSETPFDGGLATLSLQGRLYAAGQRTNLVVYDITLPDSPSELGSFRLYKHAVTVAGSRGHAYVVTNGPQGMSIVADKQLEPLREVGFLPLKKANWLSDDEVRIVSIPPYAIMQYYGFLLSVDVKAPSAPDPRRLLAVSDSVDMALVGDMLFSAGDWLRVVDMTRPGDPKIVFSRLFASGFGEAGTAQAVAADGDRLYVAIRSVTAGRQTHLWVFDISDPAAPHGIGVYTAIGPVVSMASRLGMLYVSGGAPGSYGLRVIDARDVTNIHPVGPGGTVRLEGRARFLDLDGDRLVLSEAQYFDEDQRRFLGRDGVHVFSVKRPNRPIERQFLAFPGPVGGVDLRGDRMYVAAKDQGLAVADLSAVP